MPALTRPTVTSVVERGVRDGTSIRRSFGPGGARTTRKIWCPWAEQDDCVIRHLGGQGIEYDGDDVVGLRRLTMLADAANPRLFYQEVAGITGHQQSNKVTEADGSVSAVYSMAEVELIATPVKYPVMTDDELDTVGPAWPDGEWNRYTSISAINPSAEYIQLPGGTLQYIRGSGSGTPHESKIPFGIGKVIPVVEHELTWHSIPFAVLDLTAPAAPNWYKRLYGDAETDSLVGTVNKTEFLGKLPGTLLFSAFRPNLRFDALGGLVWDITYTLAWCAKGWNYKFFHSVDSTLAGWYLTGRGTTHYDNGDVPDNYSIYNETEHKGLWRLH